VVVKKCALHRQSCCQIVLSSKPVPPVCHHPPTEGCSPLYLLMDLFMKTFFKPDRKMSWVKHFKIADRCYPAYPVMLEQKRVSVHNFLLTTVVHFMAPALWTSLFLAASSIGVLPNQVLQKEPDSMLLHAKPPQKFSFRFQSQFCCIHQGASLGSKNQKKLSEPSHAFT